MRKSSIIFYSIFLFLSLTTFNLNNEKKGSKFFKIDNIEVKNLRILNEKQILNLFNSKFVGKNLFLLDEKKIDQILNNNEIIDYIEFKKIYPSKLQVIIYEKETIAIINNKKNKFYLTKNGEEIKYFENKNLKNLPNIFGVS